MITLLSGRRGHRDKRYVLGFNPGLFEEDRRNRDWKLAQFRLISRESKDLANARRDRDIEPQKAESSVNSRDSRLKNTLNLLSLNPWRSCQLKGGSVKTVKALGSW